MRKIFSLILAVGLVLTVGFSVQVGEGVEVEPYNPKTTDSESSSSEGSDKTSEQRFYLYDAQTNQILTYDSDDNNDNGLPNFKGDYFTSYEQATAAGQLFSNNPQQFNSENKASNGDGFVSSNEFKIILEQTASNPIGNEENLDILQNNGVSQVNSKGYKNIYDEISILEGELKSDSQLTQEQRNEKNKKISEYKEIVKNHLSDNNDLAQLVSILDEGQAAEIIKESNKNECKDNMFSTVCEFMASKNEQRFIRENIQEKLKETSDDLNEKKRELDHCNRNFESKDCTNQQQDYDKAQDEYNGKLLNNLKSFMPQNVEFNSCKENGISECKKAIENHDCNGDEACERSKKNALAVADEIEGQTLVKTAHSTEIFGIEVSLYGLLNAINNKDESTQALVDQFQLNGDWSGVFGETFQKAFAQPDPLEYGICIAINDGYYDYDDDTVSVPGRITQYASDNQSAFVAYEFRARRTQVTPDNATQITTSYYVPGQDESYFMRVGLIYSSNGKLIPVNLTQKIEVSKGTTANEIINNEIILEKLDKVNLDSMRVWFFGETKSNRELFNIKVKPLLTKVGNDINVDPNNPDSNNGDSSNDSSERSGSSSGVNSESDFEQLFGVN